jgi:hypothetical protein
MSVDQSNSLFCVMAMGAWQMMTLMTSVLILIDEDDNEKRCKERGIGAT